VSPCQSSDRRSRAAAQVSKPTSSAASSPADRGLGYTPSLEIYAANIPFLFWPSVISHLRIHFRRFFLSQTFSGNAEAKFARGTKKSS
jgi:hypothetical protein